MKTSDAKLAELEALREKLKSPWAPPPSRDWSNTLRRQEYANVVCEIAPDLIADLREARAWVAARDKLVHSQALEREALVAELISLRLREVDVEMRARAEKAEDERDRLRENADARLADLREARSECVTLRSQVQALLRDRDHNDALMKAEAERDEARLERDGLQAKVDDYPCCGKCDYAKAEAERDRLREAAKRVQTVLANARVVLGCGYPTVAERATAFGCVTAVLDELSKVLS